MTPVPIVAAAAGAAAKGGAGVAAATKAGAAMAAIKPGTWKTMADAFGAVRDASNPMESLQETFSRFGAIFRPLELVLKPITTLFEIMGATMTEAMLPAFEEFMETLLDPAVIALVTDLGVMFANVLAFGLRMVAVALQWMIDNNVLEAVRAGIWLVAAAFQWLVTHAQPIWDGIVEGFRIAGNVIIVIVEAFVNFILDMVALVTLGFVRHQVNIPRLASGGIVSQPTIAMIGEAGPEAVVPLDRFADDTRGAVTIINRGTIITDEAGLARLGRMIDNARGRY